MALGALASLPATMQGQSASSARWNLKGGLPVGSEEETYLRDLQVAGLAPLYPWTIRGFTYGELKHIVPADSVDHPWKGRFDLSAPPTTGFHFGWVSPEATLYENTAYPFGENDGMVWAGRGLTADVKAGFYLTWGRLHLRVAPEAFIAQNVSFALAPNGLSGDGTLRDGRFPNNIDRPQRFGTKAYARAGPGSSQLTLTLPGVMLGASGAPQIWGPGDRYPLLVSDNGGGFDHLFIQTRPLGVGIGRIYWRFLVGRLGESRWSPRPAGAHDRFLSATVFSLTPRGVPGLELGFERFVDSDWPKGGIGLHEIFRPFGGVISIGKLTTNPSGENQVAGAFLRWVLPKAGVEVFAEAIREDFSRDLRNLIVRPDDYMGRTLGIRRVVKLEGKRLLALRAEVVSAGFHHSERDNRYRVYHYPFPLYVHFDGELQGQTQFGQLLGSPAAYGGSGWTVGADVYGAKGRWSTEIFYEARQAWLNGTVDGTGVPEGLYGAGLKAVRFHRAWEYSVSLRPSIDLNRNVQNGNDVFNLSVVVGVRGRPR